MKLKFQLGTERAQALDDISRSALYAFSVYKAISLHTDRQTHRRLWLLYISSRLCFSQNVFNVKINVVILTS